MANVKISDMTPGTALAGTELLEMTQSGATASTTPAAIKTYALGSGNVVQTVRVITAAGAITVTTADYVVVVNKTVGAASAVALPAGATGLTFVIKDGKGDAGANNITISPAAGTIDGAATNVIATNYGSRELIYNGTQWNVIG